MGFFFQLPLTILLVVIASMKDVLTDNTPKTQIYLEANAVIENIEKPISLDSETLPDFLRNTHIWLDKSLLIKYMIENDDKHHVISCPYGWGKTMNLHLIKLFFQPPITEDGKLETRKNSFGYKYFKDGVILAKNGTVMKKFHTISMNGNLTKNGRPLIGQYDELMENHFGKWPVIHFNYKNMTPKNYISRFRDNVQDAFEAHRYLIKQWDDILNSSSSSHEDKNTAAFEKKRYYSFKHRLEKNLGELEEGVVLLITLLYRWHNRRILFLIDEYDYPFTSIFLTPKAFTTQDIYQLEGFLSQFFRLIGKELTDETRTTGLIYKTITTGVTRIAQSQMNQQMTIYNFIDMKDLTDYYDVDVDTELKYLAKERCIENLKTQDAIKHYGGFRKLNMPEKKQLSIRATGHFINDRKVHDIPEHSPHIRAFIFQFLTYPEFALSLNELVNQNCAYYSIPYRTTRITDLQFYTRMHELMNTGKMKKAKFLTNGDITKIMGMLTMAGFMTLRENHVCIPTTNLNSDTDIDVVISNNETKNIFRYEMKRKEDYLILTHTKKPVVYLDHFLMSNEHESEHKDFQLFTKSIEKLFTPDENEVFDLMEWYKGYYVDTQTKAAGFFDIILQALTKHPDYKGKYSLEKEVTDGRLLRRADLILTSGCYARGLVSEVECDNDISLNRILLQTKDYTRIITSMMPNVTIIKYLAVVFSNGINGKKVIKLQYDTKNKDEIHSFMKITTDRDNAKNETELLAMLEHYNQTDESSVYKILTKYGKTAYYPLFAAYHITNKKQLFDLKLPDFVTIFGPHNITAIQFQNLTTAWADELKISRARTLIGKSPK